MDQLTWHERVSLDRQTVSRRSFLYGASAVAAATGINFRDVMSLRADELRKQGKAMILLFMQGGPSQLETFDPKPGTENGGPTTAISTTVSGIQIAEGWERTAQQMQDIAIIRSMTNKEGEHQRASYQMHTGYIPSGSVKHPSLGACIAQELAPKDRELPAVVTIGDRGTYGTGAGFLGVDYEPFQVVGRSIGVVPDNISPIIGEKRFTRRQGLLDRLEGEFAARGGETVVSNHRRVYDKSAKLVLSPLTTTFDLSQESAETKERYGDSEFGKGCLLARRLIEAGVTFVEVRLGGWDTHQEVFSGVKNLAGKCDPALAALISDLKERGLLDSTLVMWTGEFGRTPKINPRTGRDHWPRNFNALLAGGGIKGGQVIGESAANGIGVASDPVTVPDLFQTICTALEVNPAKENMSPIGRPLKIVDGGKPVSKLFG
ncbi:DUF1501 domain-containing protein [Schlesneria sp. T3-172]|uniref:DUF1501 domain-containing protein n=1 Tax=Schlesneria sphaerica TaxID=3373610 RepID=UPI0037CC26B2